MSFYPAILKLFPDSGWFRQCDIISHTTDVDIGIFIEDYRPELVNLLESKGLVLTHHFGKVSLCSICSCLLIFSSCFTTL